jgi:hypothetical protein
MVHIYATVTSPRHRVFLEQFIIGQLAKIFPAFVKLSEGASSVTERLIQAGLKMLHLTVHSFVYKNEYY